jgi:phosphate/sulfate permease
MSEIYLFLVILLFILAVSDLVVGVSNDAVNFLNSAIGSKVATRQTIMIVASLGILLGATFSSGMMEVARKGIFNPDYFYFDEIMIIFLAVMITDIILLDLFNTFGMPTSTTVSIVFELLGAAVAVSFWKILAVGDDLNTLGNYINSSSAFIIIAGIFASVFIAFLVGTLIQYFSRLLFSFHIENRMNWVGALWSGIALSAMTYFLLIKGVKGASFISDEFISWVQENTLLLLGGTSMVGYLLMQTLLNFSKINILRIVVLFGTFSLAMSFAGNDLVNFIGVPIAGFESFNAWTVSSVAPDEFNMGILKAPVRTQTYLLVIAGIIMTATLWFSKKSRSVTETEVNLGRQDEGSERFQPNLLAQGIVRHTLSLGKTLDSVIPASWRKQVKKSFQPYKDPSLKNLSDEPAFDLVRASVNLTVASMLIAIATSFKLPLSTTYVSFMVAMGTSLADRAWGRSSAVYRVTGVINVIGGWFFTAFMAFTAAATFATLIYFFGIWVIVVLVSLAIFLISRTFLLHRKKEKEKSRQQKLVNKSEKIARDQILNETSQRISRTLHSVKTAYKEALIGLIHEDRNILNKAREDIQRVRNDNKALQRELVGLIKRIEEKDGHASHFYLLVFDLSQDILQSTSLIVDSAREYVFNSLVPVRHNHEEILQNLLDSIDPYINNIQYLIKNQDFEALGSMLEQKEAIFDLLEDSIDREVRGIKKSDFGMRQSLLLFTITLETKDLVAVAARFAKLFGRIDVVNDCKFTNLVGKERSPQQLKI